MTSLRQLLAIIHCETLMQLRSGRFRGCLLLVAWIDLVLYMSGIYRQELNPAQTFFGFETYPFHLVAVVFTGLFSIGRIRTTGMHTILMVKPFPTFALMFGQLVAGLVSLLLLAALLFLPSGLLLRWKYEIEYPLAPIGHLFLFFLVPWMCGVLALTIWVRTCLKNNMTAIIVLGALMAGAFFLGNALTIVAAQGEQHVQVMRFVPMLTYFSRGYAEMVTARLFDAPSISFTRLEDWRNLGLSLLYPMVFLMLAGYHLRRTEPHRKVLGGYGRRWYHAPTFMRMAFDLKIDPHMRWRSHLLLFGMIGLIGWQTVWPIVRPVGMRVGVEGAADPMLRYSAGQVPEEKILHARILGSKEELTPQSLKSELTFVLEGPASGTLAVLHSSRLQYTPRSIRLDGRGVPFVSRGHFFIEGSEFEACADGQSHTLVLESRLDSAIGTSSRWNVRGLFFVRRPVLISAPDVQQSHAFETSVDYSWPAELALTVDARARLIDAPVEPAIEPAGKLARFNFEIPAGLNGGDILFDSEGAFEIIPMSIPDGPELHVVVPRLFAATGREVVELALPTLTDFCAFHRLKSERPVVVMDLPLDYLKQVRRWSSRYRAEGTLREWERSQLDTPLVLLETSLLQAIYKGAIGGRLQNFHELWGLRPFVDLNLTRGLNRRMTLKSEFRPPEFQPVAAQIAPENYQRLTDRPRADSNIPVMQMLYHLLGHDSWVRMIELFSVRLKQDYATADTLQETAEAIAGEPLGWFFDYWMRDGRDFPAYQINSARAWAERTGPDGEQTRYRVEVEIENIGTGRMPVPLQLTTARLPVEERVWIGAGETVTWSTTASSLPREVSVDPQGWIMTRPYRDPGDTFWITQPKRDVDLMPEGT